MHANLMDAVLRSTPTPAAPAPAAPSYDPQAYTTGQDVENIVRATAQQFQPAIERLAEQTATAIYQNTSRDPRYTDVFQKYGPEVTQYLARIPRAQWTVDIVEGAAKLVRADHLDDLARERANQIVQGMEPTIRPSGGGAAPASPTPDFSLKSEKLPTDWRERAAKVGLDERTLDEFCIANGMSREQFFGQFGKSLIVEIGKVKGA